MKPLEWEKVKSEYWKIESTLKTNLQPIGLDRDIYLANLGLNHAGDIVRCDLNPNPQYSGPKDGWE